MKEETENLKQLFKFILKTIILFYLMLIFHLWVDKNIMIEHKKA